MNNPEPRRNDDPVLIGRQSALGAGGICILQLVGAGARKLIQPFFKSPRGRNLSQLRDSDIVYGHIRDDEGVIDEVLVVRRREDFWEINCHGGAAAVSAIEDRLSSEGAVVDREAVLDSGELVGMDAVQRAAYRELIYARTARVVQMLADQVGGALSARLESVADAPNAAEMKARLTSLLETWPYGQMLLEPRRVLIMGAPNVGKSTLLNRILGYDRAITSPEPGTTVDRIGDFREIDGYPFAVTDSAGSDCGLRIADCGLEKEIKSEADLVLFVLDGSRPLEDYEIELIAGYPKRLVVINKCDLPLVCEAAPGESPLPISALTGEGMDDLLATVLAKLAPPVEPEPGSAVIFKKEWHDALRGAATEFEKLRIVIQGIIKGNVK